MGEVIVAWPVLLFVALVVWATRSIEVVGTRLTVLPQVQHGTRELIQ